MGLTNQGRNLIAQRLHLLFATNFIGVGDGSTAFAAAQTDLQGSNKLRKAGEPGFPTIATNVLTFRAVYGISEANFAWTEWGIFDLISGGNMLLRETPLSPAPGTKTSSEIWQLNISVTINNP